MRGITFGEKHSFTDYGLYLKSYPVIEPPKPKLVTVDIPGGNGSIDLTESLTGDVRYEMRTISMEFLVMDARNRWPEVTSLLLDELHGKKMKIIFDDDPGCYYLGRVRVEGFEAGKKTGTLMISADAEPWKYDPVSSRDPWAWDTFSFESGVIKEYADIAVSGSLDMTVIGSRKPTVLDVTVSAPMTLVHGGKRYGLKTGRNIVPQVVIRDGSNALRFEGNGTVTIDYRGGRL